MLEIFIEFLKNYGYWGMGILSFLAGSVIPVTSEVLLIFFLSIGLNAMGLTLAATLGNSLGGFTCFIMGYLTNKERVQRFFKIDDKNMNKANSIIQKYGFWSAALSFVPLIGETLLIALGVMRVNKYKIIVVMTIGKFIRYAFITLSYTGVAEFFSF